MKKFFIALFTVIALSILGYGIKYAVTPVNTQTINHITQENSINTNGFIIRDEWVMISRSAGTVYYAVSEGDRVSRDSVLGSLFYGNVDSETVNQLAVLDNKIRNIQIQKSEEAISTLNSNTIESNIYERENDIIDAALENDIASVARYKRDINSLRLCGTLAEDNTEQELENQKANLLAQIGLNKEDITAGISGSFTNFTDGYEELLKPSDIENYDVAYFESLSQSPSVVEIGNNISAGGVACKLINNHVWYVMMSVPDENLSGRDVGDDVKLRFNNMSEIVTDAEIAYISDESDGRRVVTVKCKSYVEASFSYRLVDVDLIFESYDGYKVPIHSIRTDDDGRQRVIGLKENRQYDCYCDVLFTNTDSGYAIVESTYESENKISQMDRIMVGER